MRWRLICDDGVTAGFGLAADEYMARAQGSGESLPVLRLYTYRSHCALVGRFQSLESEINVEYCEANGIALGRRPTGGGAIIMGEEQLGVALTLPAAGQRPALRELMARFSEGLTLGLAALGVQAGFAGKNDVEVHRRKLAGLGLYHDKSGGLLFHASLLVDLDIPLMLRVLRTPFAKVSDKAIATVAERVTTVRREAGFHLPLDQVRERVRQGYAESLGALLVPSEFSAAELAGIRQLEQEKYLDPAWVRQRPLTPDLTGTARVKAPGGLVEVHLMLAGEAIKAAFVSGDFFAPEGAVAELERRLRWVQTDELAVQRAVREFLATPEGQGMEGIGSEHLAGAVLQAVAVARKQQSEGATYGCFVNP